MDFTRFEPIAGQHPLEEVARFGAGLPTEVELDQLTHNLVDVVHETMHPTSISLWLRPKE